MEREIKFRAWDGKRITTSGIMFNNSEGILEVPKTNNDPKMILMQYTGLNDKNGKEIYDGDVLKADSWAFNWIVQFDTKKARFNCIMNKQNPCYMPFIFLGINF
jgi:uncharacterized phage protein (TIGR01671 family)